MENVRKSSRLHKRCGTSFMLLVMLVSFIVFLFVRVDTVWLRVVSRVLLLPVVGIVSWQLAAAAVTGFIAKENVVGTLAVCFAVTNFIDTEELALIEGGSEVAAVFGITKVAALAYLMFNLFTPPCFAAIGAMNSEINDKKWLAGGIALQFATGYVVSFLVYQIGTFVTEGTVGAGFVPGLIAVVVIVAIIASLVMKADKNTTVEYALSK